MRRRISRSEELSMTLGNLYISTSVVNIYKLLHIFETQWNQFTKHQILFSKLQLNVETTLVAQEIGRKSSDLVDRSLQCVIQNYQLPVPDPCAKSTRPVGVQPAWSAPRQASFLLLCPVALAWCGVRTQAEASTWQWLGSRSPRSENFEK